MGDKRLDTATIVKQLSRITNNIDTVKVSIDELPNLGKLMEEIDDNQDIEWDREEQIKELQESLDTIRNTIKILREERRNITIALNLLKVTRDTLKEEINK